MRYFLLAFLAIQFTSCKESKFHGGSDEKAVTATEEPPIDVPPQEGDVSGVQDDCIEVNTVFTNTLVARDTAVGKVEVNFTIICMENSDSQVTGVFSLYSSDFLNPTYKSGEKTPSKKKPGKMDQVFHVYFDYKWVPEVTKYNGQEFNLSFTRADGAKWLKTVRYGITSFDPGKHGQNPVASKQLAGREGHPGSKP